VQNAPKVSLRGPMSTGPLPGWITPTVIAETRAVFQPFYEDQELTDDEIVRLLLNVGTLFRILRRTPDETDQHADEADEQATDEQADAGRGQAVRRAGAGQQPRAGTGGVQLRRAG
jgi:hypothetical protein